MFSHPLSIHPHFNCYPRKNITIWKLCDCQRVSVKVEKNFSKPFYVLESCRGMCLHRARKHPHLSLSDEHFPGTFGQLTVEWILPWVDLRPEGILCWVVLVWTSHLRQIWQFTTPEFCKWLWQWKGGCHNTGVWHVWTFSPRKQK